MSISGFWTGVLLYLFSKTFSKLAFFASRLLYFSVRSFLPIYSFIWFSWALSNFFKFMVFLGWFSDFLESLLIWPYGELICCSLETGFLNCLLSNVLEYSKVMSLKPLDFLLVVSPLFANVIEFYPCFGEPMIFLMFFLHPEALPADSR